MVSHDNSGSNLPNFGNTPSGEVVESELTPLQQLNASVYIQGLRSPITRVRWSHEGMTRRWWIHFANGSVAYVPDTKTLRNPGEMEIIFSDTLGFSVMLHPAKAQRIWKQLECNWIMECAENHPAPPGSNMSQLLELIEDTSLLFMGDGTEEITGRKAARAFAEQANDHHLDRRWIGAKASNGLFLHFASLIKVWQVKYGSVPTRDTLCSTLYQASFKPTHPYPTQHAGSRTGAGDYSASVRMWFRADVGEVFIND